MRLSRVGFSPALQRQNFGFKTEQKLLNPLLNNIFYFYLRVDAGRYVVTEQAIPPAEIVLVSEPYTHVIGEHCLNWVCDGCCRVNAVEGTPFEYSCPDCDISWYCCKSCKQEAEINPLYSHAAECQCIPNLTPNPVLVSVG